jgi:hypothetical protein
MCPPSGWLFHFHLTAHPFQAAPCILVAPAGDGCLLPGYPKHAPEGHEYVGLEQADESESGSKNGSNAMERNGTVWDCTDLKVREYSA